MNISGLNFKNKILINALSSSLQAIIIGVVYFLLYRFLLKKFGVDMLGVWSLVLATSSLASVANFGITSSVVRFVSLYKKDDDFVSIQRLIFTSVVFMLILFTAFSLLVYPAATLILTKILDQRYLDTAKQILPFSLICLIINAIAGVFASVLDGFQKNYIRNIIFTISSLVMLFASYWLSIVYGMKGVAYAQILQSLFTLIICLFFVVDIASYNLFNFSWDKKIFKELFSYGMKFQIISIAAMLNEPITKTLLVKFGGLAFSGYYEMANRLVMQVRSVIINANQSLVPVIVNIAGDSGKVNKAFKKTFSIIFIVSILSMTLLCLASKLISFIWIGKMQEVFVYTILLLSLSLFINLLCSPSFFTYIAEGKLKSLIKFHLIIVIVNIIFSYFFVFFFDGYGVIYGWLVAVLISSSYLFYEFTDSNNIHLNEIINKVKKKSFLFSIFCILAQLILTNELIEITYIIFSFLLMSLIYLFGFYKIHIGKWAGRKSIQLLLN